MRKKWRDSANVWLGRAWRCQLICIKCCSARINRNLHKIYKLQYLYSCQIKYILVRVGQACSGWWRCEQFDFAEVFRTRPKSMQ